MVTSQISGTAVRADFAAVPRTRFLWLASIDSDSTSLEMQPRTGNRF
jgi:hypothetical protein